MAAGDSDDPGVLGNLPRSRPGQRSNKRSGSTRAAGAAQRAKRTSASRSGGGTKRRSTASASRTSQKPRASSTRSRPAASGSAPRRHSSDPVTGAVRLAGKVAETGVKAAVGIIKRLPGV